MKQESRGKRIAYWLMLVTLFGILFFLTFPKKTSGKDVYDVVIFGDSVVGLVRDETGVAQLLAEKTGKSIFNAALGGTCIARTDKGNLVDYGRDSMELVSITKSIAMKDLSPQKTAEIKEPRTEYFYDVVTGLEQVDYEKVEMILIEHGLNDFYSGVPLENPGDLKDEYTFAGALRKSLDYLKKSCPSARIILVTPTFTWHTMTEKDCEAYDLGYGNQPAYIAKETEIAKEYGVEVLSLYDDVFPHDTWDDIELYTIDGIHPNDEGRERIAEAIAEYLTGGRQ